MKFRTSVTSSYAKSVEIEVEAEDRAAARALIHEAIAGEDIADIGQSPDIDIIGSSDLEWESDFVGDLEELDLEKLGRIP
jgi:hypothetical protein